MKRILLLTLGLASGLYSQAQANIAAARAMGIGQTVTVKGVVTNGSELGSIRYIQDATGAIPAYGTSLNGVLRGDSITATGTLFDFSGLLEISPTSSFTNHGPAAVIPTPLNIPLTSANESIEAQLVRVDNVTFVQTGNFATGNSTVQVTDGVNTLDVRINGSTNIDGTAIPTGPLTIIALVGQFNANYQLVPRALNDIFPYVAPLREINVKVNGNTVLNNGSYLVGNTVSTPLVIENQGSGTLTISGSSFSGTNAAEFSSNIIAGGIGATSSQAYNIIFTASGNGTRTATLSIGSDDADENPYIINLTAIGLDNLATQPSSNASGLTFPLVDAYTVGGQYTAGSGASNYIVLWKNGSAISTGVPVDGQSYKRGDLIGDAKVAYIGSGNSFTPRGVIANQNYYFTVYAFNGSGGYENYLTTSPATGNVTSLGQQIGTYYNSINSSSPTFLTNLSALINVHTVISYFNYKSTMMSAFEIKDTTNGQSYVTCAYSGENKVFNDPFDWTATGYSREHTFSHSWMPTFPCDNPEKPEYNDQHNLYPTNLQQANSPRSNLPLDDITGSVVFNYLEGSVGYNSTGQLVYEPRDAQKGNAARAIFYMATSYNGANNWAIPTNQSQATLKAWHFNDLPDNYEIARNEYIYDLQGNRNPYVDSVEFVCHVNFSNMTYLSEHCTLGLEEQLQNNLVVFPVPSNDKVYVQVNGTEITAYQLMDMQGRIVSEQNSIELKVLTLEGKQLHSGTYILNIETPLGETQRKIIIE